MIGKSWSSINLQLFIQRGLKVIKIEGKSRFNDRQSYRLILMRTQSYESTDTDAMYDFSHCHIRALSPLRKKTRES